MISSYFEQSKNIFFVNSQQKEIIMFELKKLPTYWTKTKNHHLTTTADLTNPEVMSVVTAIEECLTKPETSPRELAMHLGKHAGMDMGKINLNGDAQIIADTLLNEAINSLKTLQLLNSILELFKNKAITNRKIFEKSIESGALTPDMKLKYLLEKIFNNQSDLKKFIENSLPFLKDLINITDDKNTIITEFVESLEMLGLLNNMEELRFWEPLKKWDEKNNGKIAINRVSNLSIEFFL
jgi:hypothetical protein